jgi:hypothetical protein
MEVVADRAEPKGKSRLE